MAEIHEVLQASLGLRRTKRSDNLGEGEYHYSVARHELTTFMGSKLWVKSADDPSGLHAQPLDYILIDEAAGVPFEVLQVNLLPRLTVTGGWLAATGTFESTATGQWYVDFWRIGQSPNDQGIESFRHPTTVNPFVDKNWLEAQRRIYDEDLFDARFLAIPKPDERLVFRKFSYVNHVDAKRAAFNPDLPVYLGIDPGGVYAIVAWQPKYDESLGDDVIAVIDEIYDRGGGPTEKLVQELQAKDWYPNIGSHDRITGAIDIAAKESWQIWMRHGIVGLRRNRVQIEVGNDELRNYIAKGRLVVHPKCRNLLREFSEYKYPKVVAGRDPRSRKPVDEENHAIKGLIYSVIGKHGYRFRYGGSGPRKVKRKKYGIF